MRIIELSIDDIKPYEKNPRKNDKSVEKVANSIEEFDCIFKKEKLGGD